MENQRILVIGGTGYIGREIVIELADRGFAVSVLSRHPPKDIKFNINPVRNFNSEFESAEDTPAFKPTIENLRDIISNGVNFIQADLLDYRSLSAAMPETDIVIFLAAVIRTIDKRKYKNNIMGLENAVKVMKQKNIRRLLYFSTINVTIPKTGAYGNSKKACEEMVLNSGLDFMIARPNYVYGLDKNNDFYRLYKIMKLFHVAPVIGSGASKLEPINKTDAACLTADMIRDWQTGRIAHFSGRVKISLNESIKMIKDISGLSCLAIHIPMWALKPFKIMIPFDLDGYDQDRVAVQDVLYGASDFKQDLIKIINLV